jgi:hypothetical protein
VAWFPETDITSPLPDTNEILIAAIKDLLHAIVFAFFFGLVNQFSVITDDE